jgi:hypothetical protein
MTFGSCVDAAVEVVVTCARADISIDVERALTASIEIEKRDRIDIDQDEVEQAVRAFIKDVLPHFEWSYCRTQAHVHVPLFDWGEVDGHPDLILSVHSVWDVKTGKDPKKTARTVELGMYALMVEEETGETVPEVGYIVWVRDGRYWQGFGEDAIGERPLKTGPRKGQMVQTGHHIPSTYVDDELRRWTKEQVSSYVRADKADDMLNARRKELALAAGVPFLPENYSFPGSPFNASICLTCEHNPLLGGVCKVAPRNNVEET